MTLSIVTTIPIVVVVVIDNVVWLRSWSGIERWAEWWSRVPRLRYFWLAVVVWVVSVTMYIVHCE